MNEPKFPIGWVNAPLTYPLENWSILGDNGVLLPVDGSMATKKIFPKLYEVLKEFWGDDMVETETEFSLPDLRGKVVNRDVGMEIGRGNRTQTEDRVDGSPEGSSGSPR